MKIYFKQLNKTPKHIQTCNQGGNPIIVIRGTPSNIRNFCPQIGDNDRGK